MAMSDDEARYYQALGLVTSAWAALEMVLNVLILSIFAHYDGKQVDASPPQGIMRTVKFLRRAFERIDSLAPFKEEGISMVNDIEPLIEKRHTLIHGVALAHLVVAGGALNKKSKFDKSDRGHTLSETPITNVEIWDFATEASKLIGRVSTLGSAMKDPFPGSVFDYSIR